MEQWMIPAVFMTGLLSMLVSVIALFRRVQGQSGELAAFGIKFSGSGAALFLIVGFVLLLTSVAWGRDVGQKNELAGAVAEYEDIVSNLSSGAEKPPTADSTSTSDLPPKDTLLFRPTFRLTRDAIQEVRLARVKRPFRISNSH